ncbi:MAG TPA: 23S rRNA (uracil(1939)-C(5))-methyltransferase RlmD [Synergistales bacterium]|nr:23S rRNA (uracil(1939)-C(5))-methyltransferase RlmD [Synergistales bacterium]
MIRVYEKGASVLLRTEKISSDGSGIARTPEGFVIFIPGALPGETLKATVMLRKKEYAIAFPDELLEPHPLRRQPFCPVFNSCGGCQLQHASYALQLELKRAIVQDAFERIYKRPFPPVTSCNPSPEQIRYRNKTSLPVRNREGKTVMGYFARRSHDVVPIKSCPVAAHSIDRAFSAVAESLPVLGLVPYNEKNGKGMLRHAIFRQSIENNDTLVSFVLADTLSSRKKAIFEERLLPALQEALPNLRSLTLNINSARNNVIVGPKTEVLFGDGLIEETLASFRFEYDTTAFFQVNSRQACILYEFVVDLAGLTGTERVLELFSGIGTLTSFLAARSLHVTAVEEWDSSVRMMRSNLSRNGVGEKTAIIAGAVEKVAPSLEGTFDVIVLDPPRTGCDASVLHKVLSLNPRRIIYVSCNPATLARDAGILTDQGFVLDTLTCFDLFPQTVHVETVARFFRI